MITILLKQIIDLLTGWISSFTQYASDVLEKLGLIEEDTSYLPDIKSDCDDIKDNTAAVITPINNIKSNTDAINTSSATTASNTTAIMNQAVTIGTNSGRAAAFAEDCANNTLDIKDKVVTIASDTTQIRANGNTLVTDIAEIKDLMQYYFLTNIVTEDAEGDICNFDTDLEDYLQKALVEIPADAGGISSIDIVKRGSNLINDKLTYQQTVNQLNIGQDQNVNNFTFHLKKGTYTLSSSTSKVVTYYYKDSNGITNIGANTTARTFTVSADTDCCFYVYTSAGVTASDINWLKLEVGSSASAYEEYKSYTDTVSLGSSITDGATVDLLSGMVKIHTTPETYSSITPIAIRTYKGVNNIYSDSGSMEVTYRESLKHYLDKNNQ